MVQTTLPLTLDLTIAFGIYLIAAGFSGMRDEDRWASILDDFRGSPALVYISGVMVFVLGVALILVHNVWTDPLAVIVTLLGWVAAIEGVVLLAVPEPLFDFSRRLMSKIDVRKLAIGVLIAGAVFLLVGLTGTAGL